jgi:hypothetical protein
MEFIGDIFASLVRSIAKATKAALPQSLAKYFEPDSNLGDFVGFGVLIAIFAFLIFIVRVFIYAN